MLKLKTKTRRKIKHTLTKKSLVRRKHSKHITRALFVGIMTVCAGSLAFASVEAKPVVEVSVNTVGQNGITINAAAAPPAPKAPGSPDQSGRASWYALGLPQPDALTCASRTFPRGTYLRVEDLQNGREVTCLVNDYGPAAWTGRVLDLSRGSFSQVASLGQGTIPVSIWVVGGPAAGLQLQLPSAIGTIGYDLCNNRFNTAFCETHRQDSGF